jgi:transcriptional regulator with XRE-family HTH domain
MNTRGKSPDDPAFRSRIAANIREIRRIRHLTQAELARRIGIRPGPLNAIEQAKHVPSGRVLYRLAEVLQVSVDSIMGRKPTGVVAVAAARSADTRVVAETGPRVEYVTSADTGDWPSAQTAVLGEETQPDDISIARINQVCRAFLALEDLCGAQKRAHIPLYCPFVATESGVEELALQVRQFLGIGQAVIFDYLELLENAGVRVVFCGLTAPLESAAFYDPVNANAFLIVRCDMNVERQIFELIKRLGGIYLHTQRTFAAGKSVHADGLDDLHAARKFAALFLMPGAAVRASVAQLAIDPGEWTYELVLRIKHRFGVSAQSFLMRLRELALIENGVYAAIDARIKAHYERTHFGEPDSSRRVLSPNGRLGDLLVAALNKAGSRDEAREIERTLRKAGVNWRDPGRNGGVKVVPRQGRE